MMKNYTRILILVLFAFAFTAFEANSQVTIAQWNFDAETLNPTTGSGVASNVGGTTTAYAGGLPSTGRAWNTSTYPEQGVGSGTAGAQFDVSTAGYSNIAVSWDNRMSNTAANRIRLQYTTDGTNWVNFDASTSNATNLRDGEETGFDNGRYVADTGTVWYSRTANLSAISGANNNPQFAVRLVTEFVDGSSYGTSSPGANYGPGGTVRIDNFTVTGGAGSSPMLAANPSSLTGFGYVTGQGPSASQTTSISGMNLEPGSGNITVTAPASYEVSLNNTAFSNSVVLPYTGAALNATDVFVRLKSGLAAGNYAETVNVTGGGAATLTVSVSGTVGSGLEPEISSVILPRFMQGAVPNNYRVPFAYYATLGNLLPNSTYRYYNKIIVGSDTPTYNGAGNIIFVNADGTFTRTSSPSLGTPGAYGQFTTDANGSFSGWFITEPTGNATRFKPGTELFMRIILNDGNNGNVEATWLTTEESTRVIGFGTNSADTTGTAIRGVSDFAPGNFVFLYDNTAGTGRPVYGTHVEDSNIDFEGAGTYAPFYVTDVAGMNGRWGGIVPNNNANGIMRIEERSRTNGSIVNNHTSNNGVWGSTDTRNPSGGLDGVLVINTMVGIEAIPVNHGRIYTYQNNLVVELVKVQAASVQVVSLQGMVVSAFEVNSAKTTTALNIPAGIYLVKISTSQGVFSQKVLVK